MSMRCPLETDLWLNFQFLKTNPHKHINFRIKLIDNFNSSVFVRTKAYLLLGFVEI